MDKQTADTVLNRCDGIDCVALKAEADPLSYVDKHQKFLRELFDKYGELIWSDFDDAEVGIDMDSFDLHDNASVHVNKMKPAAAMMEMVKTPCR